MEQLRGIFGSRQKLLWLVLAFSLSFNNWFLAIVLNSNLFIKGGSVSEFSVLGQPFAWVFRGLDIVSGLLAVAIGLLAIKKLRVRAYGGWIMIVSAILLGLSNIIDALLPLGCSSTVDKICSPAVHISLTHFALPHHAFSSVVIGLCYFTLPLGGLLYAGANNAKVFGRVSALLIVVALGSFASVIAGYVDTGAFSEHTWGFSQELQMALLAGWFIAWQAATMRHKQGA